MDIIFSIILWWVENHILGGVLIFVAAIGVRGEERERRDDDLSLQTAEQWSIERNHCGCVSHITGHILIIERVDMDVNKKISPRR